MLLITSYNMRLNSVGEKPNLDFDLEALDNEDLDRLLRDHKDVDIPEESHSSLLARLHGKEEKSADSLVANTFLAMGTLGVYGLKMYKEARNAPDQVTPQDVIDILEQSQKAHSEVAVRLDSHSLVDTDRNKQTVEYFHLENTSQVLDEIKQLKSNTDTWKNESSGRVKYHSDELNEIRGYVDEENSLFAITLEFEEQYEERQYEPRDLLREEVESGEVIEEEIEELEDELPREPSSSSFEYTIVGFNPGDRIQDFYSQETSLGYQQTEENTVEEEQFETEMAD